jgi:hypothetical protein
VAGQGQGMPGWRSLRRVSLSRVLQVRLRRSVLQRAGGRLPWPTTAERMKRLSSSTRSASRSDRTRTPLPCTCSSPPAVAFSSPTAAATSPDRTLVFAHWGHRACSTPHTSVARSAPRRWGSCRNRSLCPTRWRTPRRSTAQQRRVGALDDRGDARPGFAVWSIRHGRIRRGGPRSARRFPASTPFTEGNVVVVSFMCGGLPCLSGNRWVDPATAGLISTGPADAPSRLRWGMNAFHLRQPRDHRSARWPERCPHRRRFRALSAGLRRSRRCW